MNANKSGTRRRMTAGLAVLALAVGVAATHWVAATPPNDNRRPSRHAARGDDVGSVIQRDGDSEVDTPAVESGDPADTRPASGSPVMGQESGALSLATSGGERLVDGTETCLGATTSPPHFQVLWQGRVTQEQMNRLLATDPLVTVNSETDAKEPIPFRAYDRPVATAREDRANEFEAQISWSYEILGLDTLVDPFRGRMSLRLQARLDLLACTARLVVTSGVDPISLNIGVWPDAQGRLRLDLVIHVVAMNGLSNVELEWLNDKAIRGRGIGACFLDGDALELPCAVSRYLDDSYLLIQAPVDPAWAKQPSAWVRATIHSQTGERHEVAWRVAPGE